MELFTYGAKGGKSALNKLMYSAYRLMAVTDRSRYLNGSSSAKSKFLFLLTGFIILQGSTSVNTGVIMMRKTCKKLHPYPREDNSSKHNVFVIDISSNNALLYL